MTMRIGIVTPVLDDWESLAILLRETDRQFAATGENIHVFAVDDGSRLPFDPAALDLPAEGAIQSLQVIRLAANMGHQRAIAIGLIEASRDPDLDAIVVMDSDGEDRPEDIAQFIAAARSHPGQIILARRAKRSETLQFRLGYRVYKAMFRMATGRVIDFGNFSLLPIATARRLTYMPEIWNNLAACIMRSRIPFHAIATDRGTRYAGQSRMNMAGLVTHGLSAMSVYTDVIFVRMLAAAAVAGAVGVAGILVAVFMRLFTTLAAPGWATAVVGNLLVVLLQMAVIVIASALMLLAGRSSRQIIPAVDAASYIAQITRVALPGRRC
jgi:polyisoprenyl-phosphate glycosyltransferase